MILWWSNRPVNLQGLPAHPGSHPGNLQKNMVIGEFNLYNGKVNVTEVMKNL